MDVISINSDTSATIEEKKLEAADEIPEYKRATRYNSLPIIISPVVNGEDYIVVIKARNYTASQYSQPSNSVKPNGIPPKPRIVEAVPRDGYIKVTFECDDYSTYESRAQYELATLPMTTKIKTRRFEIKRRNLEYGQKYVFKCRGVNHIGKGPWSEPSEVVIPLKTPSPISDLRLVPGSEEIALYWVCNDMTNRDYDGWFEINTKPTTYTMLTKRQQCTFQKLENEIPHVFKIHAVNMIGRSPGKETEPVKSKSNITSKLYLQLKQRTSIVISELRQEYIKRVETKEQNAKKR